MNNETANQFMFLIRGAPCQHDTLSAEQMQLHVQESSAWMDDLFKRGLITVAQPLTRDRKIVSGDQGRVISDGMHAEAKEIVGGFFIINVPTMDEAVALAATCPQLKFGAEIEVRRIAELILNHA